MARQRSSSSASFIKFISERVPSSFFKDNSSSRTLPVVVNPGPSSTNSSSSHHNHNDDEVIALPSISHFTWDAVVDHTASEYTSVVDSINSIVGKYKTDLTDELCAATSTQNSITATMAKADTLTADTVKKARTSLTDASAQLARLEIAGVAKLAQLADQCHDAVTAVASLLRDIDSLLPPSEQLEPDSSAHKNHYPRLHALLQDSKTKYSQPPKIRQPQPRRAVSMSALNHSSERRGAKPRSVSSRIEDDSKMMSPFMRFDSKPAPPRLSTVTTTLPAETVMASPVEDESSDPARAKLESLMRSHTIALGEASTRSIRSG